jgi:hypothetical protein
MRKSERLRLLEMQMVRMEMLVELYSQTLNNLLESQDMITPDVESGKWYSKKTKENMPTSRSRYVVPHSTNEYRRTSVSDSVVK